jgi:hypothetical protein
MWESGSLDSSDKKIIWEWIDHFVSLSDNYVRIKREQK